EVGRGEADLLPRPARPHGRVVQQIDATRLVVELVRRVLRVVDDVADRVGRPTPDWLEAHRMVAAVREAIAKRTDVAVRKVQLDAIVPRPENLVAVEVDRPIRNVGELTQA